MALTVQPSMRWRAAIAAPQALTQEAALTNAVQNPTTSISNQSPRLKYLNQAVEPPPALQVRQPPPERARRPKKTRLGLPITIHQQGILATVLACADTGADVNIMSAEVAKTLGYSEYDALPEKKEFALANGKLVEAIGMIE